MTLPAWGADVQSLNQWVSCRKRVFPTVRCPVIQLSIVVAFRGIGNEIRCQLQYCRSVIAGFNQSITAAIQFNERLPLNSEPKELIRQGRAMSPQISRNSPSLAWRCLCLIWLLMLALPVFAGPTNLNAQWQVLVDPSSQMQPLDLLAPKVERHADTRQGMNGYKPGVFWAQFQVPAVADGQDGMLLSVGYPYLDIIDVYAWGQSEPFASMGDTRTSPVPILSFASHVIRLPALPTEQRYLLRVQTTSAMNVKAQLLSQQDLLQSQSTGQFRAGAFVTLYLLSALMYVVGAIVMRQSVQLAYALYLLCLLAIFVGVSQPILLNAWLGTPRWANWITGFGILFIPASGLLLWTVILRLRSERPALFKVYVRAIAHVSVQVRPRPIRPFVLPDRSGVGRSSLLCGML